MKLDTEFCKLPLRFDAARLSEEVAQFTPSDWRAHPQGHAGNSAVPLIAVDGDPANDSVKGPMRHTPALERCPYLRQVLAALRSVLGRTRLMRIVGNGEATAHVVPVVMTPWEQEALLVRFFEEARQSDRCPEDAALALEALLERFYRQWRSLWAHYGAAAMGWPKYQLVLDQLDAQLSPFVGRIHLPNNLEAVETIRQAVVRAALNPELAESALVRPAPAAAVSGRHGAHSPPEVRRPTRSFRFDRPIFIVAAPRSGSTLLFETLARAPGLWTIGGESHEVFESIPRLNPANRAFDSNRLTVADADAGTAAALQANFLSLLRDRDSGALSAGTETFRLLEKTPKNSLRLPFLHALFPDALFIYLIRDARSNINSILEAWRSGQFITYPQLPGWEGPPWSLLLIPEWRQLRGRPLPEIAAEQWASAHRHILDDLSAIPTEQWCVARYADVLADPQALMRHLCAFADLDWDLELNGSLPWSRHTLTPPNPDKWRKNAAELDTVLPRVESISAALRALALAKPLPSERDLVCDFASSTLKSRH